MDKLNIPAGMMLTMDGQLEPAPAYQPNPNRIGILDISSKQSAYLTNPPAQPVAIRSNLRQIQDRALIEQAKAEGTSQADLERAMSAKKPDGIPFQALLIAGRKYAPTGTTKAWIDMWWQQYAEFLKKPDKLWAWYKTKGRAKGYIEPESLVEAAAQSAQRMCAYLKRR